MRSVRNRLRQYPRGAIASGSALCSSLPPQASFSRLTHCHTKVNWVCSKCNFFHLSRYTVLRDSCSCVGFSTLSGDKWFSVRVPVVVSPQIDIRFIGYSSKHLAAIIRCDLSHQHTGEPVLLHKKIAADDLSDGSKLGNILSFRYNPPDCGGDGL